MVVLLEQTAAAGLSDELATLVAQVRESLVAVRDGRGSGSGIVWAASGVILTNHHVVRGDRAEVVLSTGQRVKAHVIKRDPQVDLALLQAETDGLRAAGIGDSDQLRVGELVVAVGNPWGLRGAATIGLVTRPPSASTPGDGRGDWLLYADVALAPGNSGGPLVDFQGRVVGINSMVRPPRQAIALPSNLARRFVESTE